MARLLVEKGTDKGKSVSLSGTSTVIIGRDTSADLQLRDGMASRMHFKLESRSDGTWLIDLDSLNGTVLNNQPVKESLLSSGDLIKVGETLFSYIADDAQSVDSLIGLRIGGYKILERVGRGGMGTVYKAEQIDLQRIVALKVISKEHLKNREFVELFVHEARASAKLNHPNVVQVYDVKKYNDLYYFSMEFVPGGNIQEHLTKVKRIPVDRSVQMILEAARGLEYAHKKEIIHRDIKPDNLMISETGSIKIGDLGLAQRMGEKLSADDENSVIGTPHYIAPEQVLGKPADYRSDIYSLGSTMYRMIAGVTPYNAPGVRDLINKKVREDAPNLHQACPDVSGPVGEVCAKMMARSPANRYPTMTEVITDLERLQREVTPAVGINLVQPSSSPRTEAPSQNRKLLVAALGLMVGIVLIAGVGAVVVMTKGPSSATPLSPEPGPFTERDANLALDTAMRLKVGLDYNSEEALLKAQRQFGDVADRYVGTKAAASARREVEDLERSLRKIHALVEIASIGELDRVQWDKMKQGYHDVKYDLLVIEPVARAYEDFAAGAAKGSVAGDDAARRAQHIRDWMARVVRAQEEFLEVKGRARSRVDERRYDDAWKLFGDFQTRTKAAALPKCDFSEHFTSLLYDDSAVIEQQKVLQSALGDWNKIQDESIAAELRHEYEKAADLLKPVIEYFTQDLKDQARARYGMLVRDAAKFKEAEDRKAAADRLAIAEADRADFVGIEKVPGIAQKVRDCNALWDFRGGLERLTAPKSTGFPRTEEYQERLKDRVEHQKRLIEFRTRFIEAFGDPANNLNREFEYQAGAPGTIKEVLADHFVIFIAGGTSDVKYKDIAPVRFVAFLQSSWKRRLPGVSAGLVAFCLESGLYEQALDELALLARGDLAEWADATKKMVLAGETTDSPELEAARRFKRISDVAGLADLAKHPELIARGWADMDVLKKGYGATKFVEGHRKELDDFAKKFTEKSDEKSRSDHKSGFKQKVLESRERARKVVDKPLSEVRGLLQNTKAVVNASERSYHLGELYAATTNLPQSNDQLIAAKNALMPKGEYSRDDEKQFHPGRILDVYLSLMRNDVLGNNADMVQRHQNECLKVQAELMGRVRDEWNEMVKQFETWRAAYAGQSNALRDAKAAWEQRPDEADPLWTLARAYETGFDMVPAFTCYAALISEFPDDERVRSGEAQFRQAECAYALRAMPLARDLFTRLREKGRKGVDEKEVGRRVNDCYELQNQLSLSKEAPPKKAEKKEKPEKE